ncbi:MAG: rod shape-determining protein MreC [Alphaproteobacteria bacterium]|jgi:rod shape-determining protein MreC|nr:rod shape-determining protein MreC [Alphaproteobacteria bacterium]
MTKFANLKLESFALRRQTSRHAFVSQGINRPSLGHPYLSLGIFSSLVGALIIFTLSIHNNKAVHHLNAALLDMTAPLVDAVTQPFTALVSWSDTLRAHKSLRAEVAFLREENERHLSLIQSLRQQALDHQQLQQLARAIPDPRIEHVSARVIGRVSDGMNALLTIKAMDKNGVAKDQPVITADGVVGRVSEVGGFSATTARVMPLTDLSSRIPVEIESSQDHGVIAGQNGPELRLIHLEKSAKVKIKAGDRLITSGYGGIFPRGLPVAVVTEVTSDMIKARPFVKETPAFVTILFGL